MKPLEPDRKAPTGDPRSGSRFARGFCRLNPIGASFWLIGALLGIVAAGCGRASSASMFLLAAATPLFLGAATVTFRKMDFSSTRFSHWTATQLAWIRIVVCLSALILTVVEDFPGIARFPVEFRSGEGALHLLDTFPGYRNFLANAWLLGVWQWLTAALLFLGLVGWNTRPTLMLGGAGFFVMQGILREYTYFFHTGLVPFYLLLVLACTPCAAAWSLDRRLGRLRREPDVQTIGFSIYSCYVVIATVYVLCGLSKVANAGMDWFRPEGLQGKILYDAMNPIFLDYEWKASVWMVRNHVPGFIYTALAAITVTVELNYYLILFSRTARVIMPVLMFALHLGILVFQHILFLDLLILQLMFVNANWIASVWGRGFHRNAGAELRPANAVGRGRVSIAAAAALACVAAGMLVIWVFRIESYPFTAWQMYAHAGGGQGPVVYYKMAVTLENGRSLIVPRRDYNPAVMPNSREILARAFDPATASTFKIFLAAYVERRNRDLTFGSSITAVEIQTWTWDYIVDGNNPHLGEISRRYRYEVGGRDGEQATISR